MKGFQVDRSDTFCERIMSHQFCMAKSTYLTFAEKSFEDTAGSNALPWVCHLFGTNNNGQRLEATQDKTKEL